MARFPAFEIEKKDDQSDSVRENDCADCQAIFSTPEDRDLHNRSKFCPGSAAIAFALYRDVRQPGGYRIEKKYLPFNRKQSSIRCQKCDLGFSNRSLKEVHERRHSSAHIECLHCRRALSTTYELEWHYQWHDDMEHRHHRDRCRRRLPGPKLHGKTLQKRHSRAGVADFGRRSTLLADEELRAIPEDSISGSRSQGNSASA